MKKISKPLKIDNINLNNRHAGMFDVALNSVELLLNNFYSEIQNCSDNPLELSKNLIATLDFLISALSKIQKGQRLALNLDKEMDTGNKEPQINFIEGLDYKKI